MRVIRRSLGGFILLVAAAFYAPVVLIWLGILPFVYRFRVLLLMTGVLPAYSLWRGQSLRDLGFRADTLKGSLAVNGALPALLVALLPCSYVAGLIRESVPPE